MRKKLSVVLITLLALVLSLVMVGCADNEGGGNKLTVTLQSTSATLQVGQSVTLLPTVSEDGATLTFTSGNTDVATVSMYGGRITAKAEGTAVITVTATLGEVTATATFNVTVSPVNNVSYTVKHYIENDMLDGWVLQDTENLTALPGSTVTATEKTYSGYTLDTEINGTLQSSTVEYDGSTELVLYYKAARTVVKFGSEGVFSKTIAVKTGTAIPASKIPEFTKASTNEYNYEIDYWYDFNAGDSSVHYDMNKIMDGTEVKLMAVYKPVTRLYEFNYKLSAAEYMLSDNNAVSMFEFDSSLVTEVKATNKTTSAVVDEEITGSAADEINLALPYGSWTISFKYNGTLYAFDVTTTRDQVNEDYVINLRHVLTATGGATQSDAGVTTITGEGAATTTLGTRKYYISSEITFGSGAVGKIIGLRLGETTDGKVLTATYSGGNMLYINDTTLSTALRFICTVPTSAANLVSNPTTKFKLSAIRNGDYQYIIFVNDVQVANYTATTNFDAVVGVANDNGDKTATFENFMAITQSRIYDDIIENSETGLIPMLGGEYNNDLTQQTRSLVTNHVPTSSTSGTADKSSVLLQYGVNANVYYVEATFGARSNDNCWDGVVLNTADTTGAITSSACKWYGIGIYDNKSTARLFLHQSSTSGDGTNFNTNLVGTAMTIQSQYTIGALRIGANYFVFVNDVLVDTFTVGDASNGTFGIFIGNHGATTHSYSNYGFAVGYDEILKKYPDLFAKVTFGENVTLAQSGACASSVCGDATITSGSLIGKGKAVATINVPEGKVIDTVKILRGTQETTYSLTAESGVITATFSVNPGAEYKVEVTFVDEPTEAKATVKFNLKSAGLTVGTTEYAFYEVDAKDATVTLTNLSSGAETPWTATTKFNAGTYKVDIKYCDSAYASQTYGYTVNTLYVSLNEGENVIDATLSEAYLGGASTVNGITNYSFGVAGENNDVPNDGTRTSGNDWALIGNSRDAVTVMHNTFALADGFTGTKYYIEGVFDSTENTQDFSTTFAGLLLAHGNDAVLKGGTSTYKIGFAVRGSKVGVITLASGWSSNGSVLVDWKRVLDGADVSYDETQIKLGVIRDSMRYYVFVNDVFVKSYYYSGISGESGIGVVGMQNSAPDVSIRKINYTKNADMIDAMIAALPENESGAIDIYLIAGQSNAAGYTTITSGGYGGATYAYNNYSQDLKDGFENVLYAGTGRGDGNNYATLVENRQDTFVGVKLGLGQSTAKVGPEAGMAVALANYYNPASQKTAAIIKFAHGGTSLSYNNTGGSNQFGNWVSPSYANYKGYSMATSFQNGNSANVTNKTGNLYRGLIAEVKDKVEQLLNDGYSTVNIMGLYWMQGESDRGNPAEYKIALKYFISDVRSDLSSLMNNLCGADCGASTMAFAIGGISEYYNVNSASAVATNQAFIAMQKAVASEVSNTYYVSGDTRPICAAWNGSSVSALSTSTDMHHWGLKDCLDIGKEAGEKLLVGGLGYNPFA